VFAALLLMKVKHKDMGHGEHHLSEARAWAARCRKVWAVKPGPVKR
jgi:hypothetical protein